MDWDQDLRDLPQKQRYEHFDRQNQVKCKYFTMLWALWPSKSGQVLPTFEDFTLLWGRRESSHETSRRLREDEAGPKRKKANTWERRSSIHHIPVSRQTNTTNQQHHSSRGRRSRQRAAAPVRRWDGGQPPRATRGPSTTPSPPRTAGQGFWVWPHRGSEERRGEDEEWAVPLIIREVNPSGGEEGANFTVPHKTGSASPPTTKRARGRPKRAELGRNEGEGRSAGAWFPAALSSVQTRPKTPLGKQTSPSARPGPSSTSSGQTNTPKVLRSQMGFEVFSPIPFSSLSSTIDCTWLLGSLVVAVWQHDDYMNEANSNNVSLVPLTFDNKQNKCMRQIQDLHSVNLFALSVYKENVDTWLNK
jgi:hypothetical protein